MPFKKGEKRLPNAGRKPGTLNRKTQDLFEICEKHNLDVFEGMVILTINEEDTYEKFNRLKELAQYLYPKRKAVEMSNAEDKGFKIIFSDYSKDDKETT